MTRIRSLMMMSVALFVLFVLSLNYNVAINLGKTGILYSDFGKFYQSARSILLGKSAYAPVFYVKEVNKSTNSSKNVHRLPGSLNPPIFALFILPLGFFSYAVSIWLWSGLSILCGLLSIFLLQRKFFDKEDSTPMLTCGLVLAFFSYYPNYVVIQFGQNPLILLPFLIGAWLAARENKLYVAAFLLGIATSIKPFFGLFGFYFLLRREWRALFLYAGIILISILLPLALFGKKVFLDYYGVLNEIRWAASSWNASVWGELLRLFGGNHEINKPLMAIPGLTEKIYLPVCGLLLLAYTKLVWPQTNLNPVQKCDLDFSATIVFMLLLSPLAWIYYFSFLMIPLITLWLLVRDNRYHPVALPILIAVLIILTALPAPLIASGFINKKNFISIFLWSSCYTVALLMLIGILFFVRRTLPNYVNKASSVVLSNRMLTLMFCAALLPSFLGIMKTANAITVHGYEFLQSYKIAYFGS